MIFFISGGIYKVNGARENGVEKNRAREVGTIPTGLQFAGDLIVVDNK